jgi:hypothetical protein
MRDIATINAICFMIRNRRQVADIPNHCGGEAGLKAAIRRFCEEGHVAFDEETERHPDALVPDWDALVEIVKVFCLSED